ncbi:hypothetical protein L9F63_018643, partial [Diploptera punctata]
KSAEIGEVLEVKEIVAKFTTDVIASCAFGIQCNCLKDPDAEFRKWGKKIVESRFEQILRDLLYITMPSLAIKLKISNTPNDITTFFRSLVQETVSFREKHCVSRKDFIQLLIQLKNGDNIVLLILTLDHDEYGNGMSISRIEYETKKAAPVFVLLIGGFETSSTTISFCLYELALNKVIQDRLRNEMDEVLKKHGGQITYEAVQEMEYLDNFKRREEICETLRKYPPVSFLARECTKEYRIPDTNITVDKGVQIVIPNQALQYDPQYFPEPEKFDPDRFREDVSAKRHRFVYLPFGEGPRICIGMRFGMMQTKVGLINLLLNYQFDVCYKTSIPLIKDPKQFITSSKHGIWLSISQRSLETHM